MLPYHRTPQPTLPSSAVKIVGLGGAGVNMLERVAIDGSEGTELLALNTDVRTLAACVAGEKIQLGRNLTKGLGSGGDPELGHQAMLEAETEIRDALRGRKIVFLCVGLGGGTGSGAAPALTRIAREEGAFVVVFATMPFAFEGRRRRDQAETTLNELAVLANALVTFDNNRMGELVLAKQGIHEAFAAADHMICESIKAVIRLVVRPGLINIGLDDLMSALRTNRSRCLFGSGIAKGKDRAAGALRNALASPLLDQGALLKAAQTVLVHLCGGEDLTLYEVELLMQRLQKFIPESAHVLFGAVVDPAMGENLSITLISALPEDSLTASPRHLSTATEILSPSTPEESLPPAAPAPLKPRRSQPASSPAQALFATTAPLDPPAVASGFQTEFRSAEPTPAEAAPSPAPTSGEASLPEDTSELLQPAALSNDSDQAPWDTPAVANDPPAASAAAASAPAAPLSNGADDEPEPPKLKLGLKSQTPQNELSFDSTPRGRFEGQVPNVVDGEDLDLPPFLRKKK
ncbi:MAG: hypothetical protein DVB26_01620 [Verrucomicrobia bacterium]|nr:MAG: hypothetical protein DVB26_01620 [Verrucomicrobiota bacterium]